MQTLARIYIIYVLSVAPFICVRLFHLCSFSFVSLRAPVMQKERTLKIMNYKCLDQTNRLYKYLIFFSIFFLVHRFAQNIMQSMQTHPTHKYPFRLKIKSTQKAIKWLKKLFKRTKKSSQQFIIVNCLNIARYIESKLIKFIRENVFNRFSICC